MLTLSDRMLIPPGGWRFHVAHTGHDIIASSHSQLYNLVVLDLEEAGIVVPIDYLQIFNDELCHQIDIQCEGIAPATDETRTLTAADVTRFLKVMAAWIKNREMVSQAEAERRAEICVGCRYNVPVTGCSVCQGIAGKIANLIGSRTTRLDSQLRGCAVCACENKAQVHLPLDILARGANPTTAYPEWCWKRATADMASATPAE